MPLRLSHCADCNITAFNIQYHGPCKGAAGSTKMVVPGTNQIQRAFNVKYPTEYIQRPEKWQANQTAFAAFYEAL